MNEQTNTFAKVSDRFAQRIGVGNCLDAKRGTFYMDGRRCDFFYLEGFLNKQALERVITSFCSCKTEKDETIASAQMFAEKHLHFAECVSVDFADAINRFLSGFLVILIEGFEDTFLAAEVRTMPQRSIQEPSKGKTLRGPHEGFSENIVTNLALLRRRIKTPKLVVKEFVVGKWTQTRVALCYINGVAKAENIRDTEQKLDGICSNSITMGEESIVEQLFYQKRSSLINPLPRARFSERPDTCAAELVEGKIVLLIDTTPNAVILPMTLFEYFEECDNYYFPPLTASYLRMIRFFSFLVSVFLVPVWLLLVNQSATVPESFAFLLVHDPYAVPLFLQLIIIEIAIDSLKLASLNTPDPLANSLSVVGGLLLGDFAVKSGWFVPQTILYSAIVSILNFIPNNYELGYSLKFFRVLLVVLVELFGLVGLLSGTFLIFLCVLQMKDAAGKRYLFPLIPFNARALSKIFLRTRHGRESDE